MRIDDDVVDRPAEEGARVVALALLGDASAAAERLVGSADDEALHDFRVGLRRLRTTLRAYRPWLEESVSRRVERKLKRQASATNAPRDAEVQLAWLRAKREQVAGVRQQAGVDLMIERIEAARPDVGDASRTAARFARRAAKLARRLGTYERQVEPGGPGAATSLGGVLAALIDRHLDAFRERLGAIGGAGDEQAAHRARIEGKRLRYLLEPLRGNRHADAASAVRSLKRIQDVLGELHDSHVLAHEVEAAMVEAAGRRARQLHAAVYEAPSPRAAVGREPGTSPRAGLLAVARLVRERRDALFAELDHHWRAGGIEALAAEVRGVVAALEARAGGRVERQRRYLLSAVPPRAGEAPATRIVQGWLPGERLRERIRWTHSPEGDRYWRGLKQGAGLVRREEEEETTREVFEALWPLTAGHRVSKVRRRIDDGRLSCDVDEFLDRDLVLAEVRLPSESGPPSLPDWLQPLVVREVTDDAAYQGESLAAAPPGFPDVAAAEGAGGSDGSAEASRPEPVPH